MVKAGSFNIGSQLEFNLADELPIVLKAKLPKLVLGPLEVGLLGEYQATGSTVKGTGVLAPVRLSHIIRIKDTLARGKLDLNFQEKKATYSKKLRVPGLNTELLRLTLTTGWGHTESQGLLNKLFNFSLAFSTDSIKLANPKVPEQFSASFHPKFGLPAGVFRTLRIPGNLYLKPTTHLEVLDAAQPKDMKASLSLTKLDAVIRLYSVDAVKPSKLSRKVKTLAAHILDDSDGSAVKAIMVEAPLREPDAFDTLATKSREWSKHISVSMCQATALLQEKYAQLTAQPAKQ